MGALARPGPQLGVKGPRTPQTGRRQAEPFSTWFPAFLRDELSPYPGRLPLVLRMTLAATLTMLVIMTFRLPGAAIAAYYTLILARDSPLTTVRNAWHVMVSYLLGSAYCLICLLLFVDYPLTHFLWVAVSMFLCFYVIKVSTNYTAGAAFAFVITIVIPIWDTPLPTGALVVATLWTAASVSVGLFCTIAVEYLFALFREIRNELHTGLATRTDTVSAYLRGVATSAPDQSQRAHKVQQLAMVGVSRLRRLATSASAGGNSERRSTTVSLVGRIVDLCAALDHAPDALKEAGKDTLIRIADQLDALDPYLGSPTPRAKVPQPPSPSGPALVVELERTVSLLQLSLSSASGGAILATETPAPSGNSDLLPDAFTNPDHLLYSLRGCLAAMLCYVLFNAVAWRGLSTSLATCAVTALSSVGASRQKQLLRISGAMVGGLLFGIGSQVLILPMLDSISGFTTLFVIVTFIAAWCGTSSPRLSYFGQQIALAYFLINLQEPFPQTNLGIARDRVLGIALGLLMMWLVFDTLGSKPAAQVMRDLFSTNLRLLARLARPWHGGQPADLHELRSLRDKISTNFGSVNAQGDAVLFELGPTRQRDLRLRDRLLAWQPRLRSVFLIEIALLQYRATMHPKELAPAVLEAQQDFDRHTADTLHRMADAFQNRRAIRSESHLQAAYDHLEATVTGSYNGQPTPRAQGVLGLSKYLAELLDNLCADLSRDPRL